MTEHGDGTWSYGLPEGFDPEVRVQGRILTWRYVGQAIFSREPRPVSGPMSFVAEREEPRTSEQQVLDMRRLDRWGRLWRVESIEAEAWRKAIAEADRDSRELTEEEPVQDERDHPGPAAPGTKVEWWPASWGHFDCDTAPNPRNDTHFWDGESRTRVGTFRRRWQKAAAQIVVNGAPACSGALLGQDHALTAAHCVSDNNDNPVPTATVQVCRDDIACTGPNCGCIGARDIDFSDRYRGGSGAGGGTDFEDDWAIVELTSTWRRAGFRRAEVMHLSAAGDGTLDDLDIVRNLGFPQFAPDCTPANGNILFDNQEMEPIAATLARKLRLKIDLTPGHSGGPFYYCPVADDNVCLGNEMAFVYGVVAGWNSVNNRVVGPKVSSFRSAALAFLND